MIQSAKSPARITDQTRSLITDYYKLSLDKNQTNNIPPAGVGHSAIDRKRASSPPSPTNSTRQNTVISDIKDHQSLSSLESEEQHLSPEELHKLLRDPKISKKEKESISKALLEGNMSYYHEFLNNRSVNSKSGNRQKSAQQNSHTLLKEIHNDQTKLLRMRHRLPKPNFLEIAPESMPIPIRSGREVREEKLSLMRRGLTTAGHNPYLSPHSMVAVAQRHQQLQEIQKMSFEPEPNEFPSHFPIDSSFMTPHSSLMQQSGFPITPSQQMVGSITLMQSEQVHHIGTAKSSHKLASTLEDQGSVASGMPTDIQTGGKLLEMDRSINGDLAENSSIELSHHEGGDDFSASSIVLPTGHEQPSQPSTATNTVRQGDFMLTSVPGQQQSLIAAETVGTMDNPNLTMSLINNVSTDTRNGGMNAGDNNHNKQELVTHANVRHGLTSSVVHGIPPQHLYNSLSKNMIVRDMNPKELYSKLVKQDKEKRIAQLKIQLQLEKENIARLKAHAKETIEKKVGLKKQLDGFRQQLKDYLDKNKHPLRGAILRCVDDSMIYHLLQRYDGFSLTPEAILMLLGNSLGTSILVDPLLQHQRETGLPNNNIITEHPEFTAWKAEEKAAHEHIVMERLAPLMEAVTVEGILPQKALVSDFNSTMNINNYQHFGQRHPYRLPALMHVKKHEDPRNKVERIQLDPNPFRDHDRSSLTLPHSTSPSISPARPRVNLRPASPPGSPLRGGNPLLTQPGVRPWTTDTHRQPLMHSLDGSLQLVQSFPVKGPLTKSMDMTGGAAPTVAAGFRMMQSTGRSSSGGQDTSGTYAQDDMMLNMRGQSSGGRNAHYSLASLVHGVRQEMLPKSMRPELLHLSNSQHSHQLGGQLLELDDEFHSQMQLRQQQQKQRRRENNDNDDDVSSLGDDRSAVMPPEVVIPTSRSGGLSPHPTRTLGKGGLNMMTTRQFSGENIGVTPTNNRQNSDDNHIQTQSAISIMHESLIEEGILYVEPDTVLTEEQIAALGKHERTADAVISQIMRMKKYREEEEARRAASNINNNINNNNNNNNNNIKDSFAFSDDSVGHSDTEANENEPEVTVLKAESQPPSISIRESTNELTVQSSSTTVFLASPTHHQQQQQQPQEPSVAMEESKQAPLVDPLEEEMQFLKRLQEEEAQSLERKRLMQQEHPEILVRRPSFQFNPSPQLLQFEAEQAQKPGLLHSATSAFVNSPANPHFVKDTDSVGSKSTAENSELFKPDLLEMQQQAQKRQMIKTPLLGTPDPKEKIDALIMAMSSHHKRATALPGELSRSAPRALKTREKITIYHNRGSHVSRGEDSPPRNTSSKPHNKQQTSASTSTLDPSLMMLPVSSNEALRQEGLPHLVDAQSLPAISPYENYNHEVKVMSSGVPAGAGLMLWRPRHVVNMRDGHAHIARYNNPRQATTHHRGSSSSGKLSKPFVSAT